MEARFFLSKKGIVVDALILIGILIACYYAFSFVPYKGDSEKVTAQTDYTEVVRIKKGFEQRYIESDGSCTPLMDYMKERLNDPTGFQHIATEHDVDYFNSCMDVKMRFRAKNGFGALMLGAVRAKVSFGGQVLSVESD